MVRWLLPRKLKWFPLIHSSALIEYPPCSWYSPRCWWFHAEQSTQTSFNCSKMPKMSKPLNYFMALSWVTSSLSGNGECAQGNSSPHHSREESFSRSVLLSCKFCTMWLPSYQKLQSPRATITFPLNSEVVSCWNCLHPISKHMHGWEEAVRAETWMMGSWLPLNTGETSPVPSWWGAFTPF